MKNNFVVDVLNSCVGFFVLLVLLSDVDCGAGGGFLLRWGHRRLFLGVERWAPLLGSQLLRHPNREHEQYESGDEGRHLILQQYLENSTLYTVERGGYLYP